MVTVLLKHVLCQNDSNPDCFKFGEKNIDSKSLAKEKWAILSTNLARRVLGSFLR